MFFIIMNQRASFEEKDKKKLTVFYMNVFLFFKKAFSYIILNKLKCKLLLYKRPVARSCTNFFLIYIHSNF
jgi:hypothetical protein